MHRDAGEWMHGGGFPHLPFKKGGGGAFSSKM